MKKNAQIQKKKWVKPKQTKIILNASAPSSGGDFFYEQEPLPS